MTIKFAPEKEVLVKTLEEARETLTSKFNLKMIPISITDLSMTKEYHLEMEKKEYALTQRAFKGLLKQLRIPFRFGVAIPEDLLEHIVFRLRAIKPSEVEVFTQGNTVYSLAPGNYQPPDIDGILQNLGDRKLEMARVGTDGVRLATITETSKIEVVKDDIIKTGIYFVGCHTGRPLPLARLMTYRVVCSNGAMAGKIYGEVHWSRHNGESLNMFLAGLAELRGQEKYLLPVLKGLVTRHITDREFTRLWKQTRKLVGGETADRLFSVSDDRRKEVMATANAKRHSGDEPEALEDLPAYAAFNSLSQFANELPGAQAERMQRVAGLLLTAGD